MDSKKIGEAGIRKMNSSEISAVSEKAHNQRLLLYSNCTEQRGTLSRNKIWSGYYRTCI